MTQKILEEIQVERTAQDAQWGGPSHDDKHGAFEWCGFIGDQIEKIGKSFLTRGMSYAETPDYRARLVKIAALAIATLESMDRKAAKQA